MFRHSFLITARLRTAFVNYTGTAGPNLTNRLFSHTCIVRHVNDVVGRQFAGGQDARCFPTSRCRLPLIRCVRPATTRRAAVAGRCGSRSARSAGTTGYCSRRATRRTTATARVRPDTGRRTTTPRSASSWLGQRRTAAFRRYLGRRARPPGSAHSLWCTSSTDVESSPSSTT